VNCEHNPESGRGFRDGIRAWRTIFSVPRSDPDYDRWSVEVAMRRWYEAHPLSQFNAARDDASERPA
jgi:hypothetical protein